MRFRRTGNGAAEHPLAGVANMMTGRDAIAHAARVPGEVLVASTGDVPGFDAHDTETRDVLAVAAGLALQGVRVTAVDGHDGVDAESLATTAGRRLALVVHQICRARNRQAGAAAGAHDSFHALADTGAFLMFARNAQDVADFALIARRVAEQSLTPGVCAQDLLQTSDSVASVREVDEAFARGFVGSSDDVIDAPTPAQAVLFGATRRRLPVLLDVDRPAGIGGVQDRDSYFRALAVQQPFFGDDVASHMDDAMRRFGEATGRTYQRVSGYRADDADVVVVGQGAIMDDLAGVVDALREERKIRAGLVNVSVFRPFAGAALSHLLKGRRAVVVLERTAGPLAGTTPLLAEVSAALDCAIENGQSAGAAPYPGYAVIRRLEERPRLFSGIYGVGGDMPSFAELAGVFEHALAKDGARRFFVGARVATQTRRFPHLEALQQRLARDYPALSSLALAPAALWPRPARTGGSLQLRSHSAQGGLLAGNAFAKALGEATGWTVRTFAEGGLDGNLQPATLTIAWSARSDAPPARPMEAGAVLVSGEQLLESVAVECPLQHAGVLVVGSVQEPEAWWRGLSRRTANWVRDHELRVQRIDARKIATETAAHGAHIDQLAIWSLLGAFSRHVLALDAPAEQKLLAALRARLASVVAGDAGVIDAVMASFARGGDEAGEVAWTAWSQVEHPVGEPDAPWTVRGMDAGDGSVFDPVRFWSSVGYLYDGGQAALTLADPHLAAGIVPARSSAFRDLSRYRLRIPQWDPSACTGCGDCWALCPESALPSTLRSVNELYDAAARECERTGGAFVQLKRIGDALVKQAVILAKQQGPQPYVNLGVLMDDAFARVVDKAGLTGEKLDAVKQEFVRLRAVVDGFPVAVTERFFAAPAAGAGTGRLLTIALNPNSCNACGMCVAACPEDAFDWTAQTPEGIGTHRRTTEFVMSLPPLEEGVLQGLIRDDDAATEVARLLDARVYHCQVGGDGAAPGNGAKTALHLVGAAVEAAMRPRQAAHAERLGRLIARIEKRIQGSVDEATKINDFEDFGRRLSRVTAGSVTPDMLRDVATEREHTVDVAELSHLTRLLHALNEQRRACTAGDGRARMIMVVASGGNAWSGTYPYNPHSQPWVAHHPREAAALARGVWDGVVRRLGAELAVCRQAEQALEDPASLRDAVAAPLTWGEFSAEERRLAPVVMLVVDASEARDASVQSLLDGETPLRVLIIDRDPVALSRRGTAAMPANAPDAFVLQSSISHAGHLMRGVAASLDCECPALFRVYAPDATRDGLPAEGIAELARLAVECRAVALYVAPPGGPISLEGNSDPAADWTFADIPVKEPSGADGHVRAAVTVADWAARQARYRSHFDVVARGHRSDQTRPLDEYLTLTPGSRAGIEPCIHVRDRGGRHALAIVSDAMVDAAEAVAKAWRDLRDRAGGVTKPAAAPNTVTQPFTTTEAAAAPAARVDADAVGTLAENLLRLSGYGSDENFFRRRLREFVAQPEGASGDAE